MTTLAKQGQPGTCPTCGTPEYVRIDRITRATRWNGALVWEDGTMTLDDESGDVEVEVAEYGPWTCLNNHPITDAHLVDAFDALQDGSEIVQLGVDA